MLPYIYKQKGISETTTDAGEVSIVNKETKDPHEAMAFLCGLNQAHYQGLMDEPATSYLSDRDEY